MTSGSGTASTLARAAKAASGSKYMQGTQIGLDTKAAVDAYGTDKRVSSALKGVLNLQFAEVTAARYRRAQQKLGSEATAKFNKFHKRASGGVGGGLTEFGDLGRGGDLLRAATATDFTAHRVSLQAAVDRVAQLKATPTGPSNWDEVYQFVVRGAAFLPSGALEVVRLAFFIVLSTPSDMMRALGDVSPADRMNVLRKLCKDVDVQHMGVELATAGTPPAMPFAGAEKGSSVPAGAVLRNVVENATSVETLQGSVLAYLYYNANAIASSVMQLQKEGTIPASASTELATHSEGALLAIPGSWEAFEALANDVPTGGLFVQYTKRGKPVALKWGAEQSLRAMRVRTQGSNPDTHQRIDEQAPLRDACYDVWRTLRMRDVKGIKASAGDCTFQELKRPREHMALYHALLGKRVSEIASGRAGMMASLASTQKDFLHEDIATNPDLMAMGQTGGRPMFQEGKLDQAKETGKSRLSAYSANFVDERAQCAPEYRLGVDGKFTVFKPKRQKVTDAQGRVTYRCVSTRTPQDFDAYEVARKREEQTRTAATRRAQARFAHTASLLDTSNAAGLAGGVQSIAAKAAALEKSAGPPVPDDEAAVSGPAVPPAVPPALDLAGAAGMHDSPDAHGFSGAAAAAEPALEHVWTATTSDAHGFSGAAAAAAEPALEHVWTATTSDAPDAHGFGGAAAAAAEPALEHVWTATMDDGGDAHGFGGAAAAAEPALEHVWTATMDDGGDAAAGFAVRSSIKAGEKGPTFVPLAKRAAILETMEPDEKERNLLGKASRAMREGMFGEGGKPALAIPKTQAERAQRVAARAADVGVALQSAVLYSDL